MISRHPFSSNFFRLVSSFLCARRISATSLDAWDLATRECPLNIPAPLQHHGRFGCPVPIDDNVAPQPARWSPWTHHPDCVNASRYPEIKYCVFTNSRHGIRGISIITTPEVAASNVEILNEGVPSPVETKPDLVGNYTPESPYEIVDIPGKGKGVIATRNISQYEQILVDYASIVVDMEFPSAVWRWQGYHLLDQAADQLSDPDRVLGLSRTSEFAENVIEDVLRTNAFHTPLGEAPFMALYPDVARINHACSPNAFTRFLPNSLSVNVAAGREIQKGEEIAISYITVGQPSEQRQKALQRWGFKCACSLCSSPKDELAASDWRRIQIETKRDKLADAYQEGNAPKSLQLANEVLELGRTEGLFQLYADMYEDLARIYWAIKDKKNAEKYARISLGVLEEQGYIKNRPELIQIMLNRFEEEG